MGLATIFAFASSYACPALGDDKISSLDGTGSLHAMPVRRLSVLEKCVKVRVDENDLRVLPFWSRVLSVGRRSPDHLSEGADFADDEVAHPFRRLFVLEREVKRSWAQDFVGWVVPDREIRMSQSLCA